MDQTPKQQVIEQLKAAKNFAITTSAKPTVDDVVSVIGLGLMLRKLGKHINLIISQDLPKGIEFITNGQGIEKSAENTRDFVIEFDRSKVDKLRYKKEEDTVKIFLTPYRTTLSKDDFNFSQGDYNIDVLVAIGVKSKEDLDPAIGNNTRILHDATVIGMVAGAASDMAGINWSEPEASSVSEMLVSISEALQGNLLDERSSTAFLAGIIAATDHFTNKLTTPKVMTMAAQLMASGADQQMIIAELKKAAEISIKPKSQTKPSNQPKADPLAKPEVDETNADTENDMTVQLESSLEKEFNIHPEDKSEIPAGESDSELDLKEVIKKDQQPLPATPDDAKHRVLPPVAVDKSKLKASDTSNKSVEDPLKAAKTSAVARNVNENNPDHDAPQESLHSHRDVPLNQTSAPRPSTLPASGPQINRPANQFGATHPAAGSAPSMPPSQVPSDSHVNVRPPVPTLRPVQPSAAGQPQQQPPAPMNHPPVPPSNARSQPGYSPGQAPTFKQTSPSRSAPTPPVATSYQPPAAPSASPAAPAHDIESARKAVEEAISHQQFDPAHNPLQSIGSQMLDDQSDPISLNR